MKHSPILEKLIDGFSRLPGIGKKSARRLAYHIIRQEKTKALDFASSIIDAKEKLNLCSNCYNLTEDEVCIICSDEKRGKSEILVVENFNDLYLFESLHIFRGSYHVLGGLLNPLDGIGPSQIKLNELFERVKENQIDEIIIGLGQSVESDTTAMYINNALKNTKVKISRLARGIPVGGEIEYTDEVTLKQALENRKQV